MNKLLLLYNKEQVEEIDGGLIEFSILQTLSNGIFIKWLLLFFYFDNKYETVNIIMQKMF